MLRNYYIKRLLWLLTPYSLILGWVSLHKIIYQTKPYPCFINDFLDKRSDEMKRILCMYKDTPSKSIQKLLNKIDYNSACYKEYRNLTASQKIEADTNKILKKRRPLKFKKKKQE